MIATIIREIAAVLAIGAVYAVTAIGTATLEPAFAADEGIPGKRTRQQCINRCHNPYVVKDWRSRGGVKTCIAHYCAGKT